MRALSNTPLRVDCTFLMQSPHVSKTRQPATSLNKFYVTFDDIKKKKVWQDDYNRGSGEVRSDELLAGAVHDDGVEQDTQATSTIHVITGGARQGAITTTVSQIPYGEETVRYL